MKPAEFADMFDACREGREWAVANCLAMDDAWATARPDWLVWIATRPGVLDDRTLRRFAVWCARAWITDAKSQATWLRANAKPNWERARKMGGAR